MTTHPTSEAAEVVVYWRPGCGFCRSLRRQLDRHHVRHRLVNIWDDATGAAHVRSVAGGNETVPTVTVGPVSIVNPSVAAVIAAAARYAPDSLPAGVDVVRPSGVARLIARILGV